MGDRDPWFDRMRSRFRLEHGLAVGGLVIALGVTSARSCSRSGRTAASAASRRRAWPSLRRDAHHRRRADLLLVVPAEHPGPAPPVAVSDHDVPGGGPSVAEPLVAVDAARRSSAAEEARTLLAGTGQGALASLSEDGAPWSSYVAYGVLEDGSPVLCLSQLAEHGRNLLADPRASLLVVSPAEGPDPLAAGRVTLAGRVATGRCGRARGLRLRGAVGSRLRGLRRLRPVGPRGGAGSLGRRVRAHGVRERRGLRGRARRPGGAVRPRRRRAPQRRPRGRAAGHGALARRSSGRDGRDVHGRGPLRPRPHRVDAAGDRAGARGLRRRRAQRRATCAAPRSSWRAGPAGSRGEPGAIRGAGQAGRICRGMRDISRPQRDEAGGYRRELTESSGS